MIEVPLTPAAEPLTLAVSLLCENPSKLTGITSTFRELIVRSLEFFPGLRWLLFVGGRHPFDYRNERLRIVRVLPGNNRPRLRLISDHFVVPEYARQLGADLLLTIGFVPLMTRVPTVMHVFTLHHLDAGNRTGGLRARYRTWAVESGLRRAAMIFTNSQDAFNRITIRYDWVCPKLRLSYEGLDHKMFSPVSPDGEAQGVRQAFSLPDRYILFLSNLYPYKQADKLLLAFAELKSEPLCHSVSLVFAGGDWNGETDKLRDLTNKAGLESRVKFLGWVDDDWLPGLLRNAELFVLPSREETFGRSVAEAMGCATPCLVNDIPVMREVTNGAAFFTDFSDPRASALALRQALLDGPARSRVANAGITEAARFSFDRLTRERITELYELCRRLKKIKARDELG